MIKSKIFSSKDIHSLQLQINQWLENTSWIKVKNITQSSDSNNTIISIWYEEPDVPILD